ncbi:lipase chaperone [Pantoea agglomerans]|uniref:lipase chaperone n=1 Tax=Enterobacter agglomerans TaxID=549 RepID=UPI0007E5AFB0|nr:lipase chaperone [Pantoea agglomerans]WHU88913.1 lipase chaperone [Pantoea agglomerans pv. gypsophilae]
MAINKKNDICEYALSSLNDVVSFARFVNYAEDLPQLNDLFEGEHDKDNYQQIWFELEVINALALSEWEIEGRPADWQTRWLSDYKQDASELIGKLLRTLK